MVLVDAREKRDASTVPARNSRVVQVANTLAVKDDGNLVGMVSINPRGVPPSSVQRPSKCDDVIREGHASAGYCTDSSLMGCFTSPPNKDGVLFVCPRGGGEATPAASASRFSARRGFPAHSRDTNRSSLSHVYKSFEKAIKMSAWP